MKVENGGFLVRPALDNRILSARYYDVLGPGKSFNPYYYPKWE